MLIAYLSSENLQMSLIIALAFCLIMSYSNTQEVLEKFEKIVNRSDNENFSDYSVIMNEHYLPNNEPEDLDSQHLKSQDENLVDEEDTEVYQPPPECQNDTYKQACIDYCYSEAGFDNEFCKDKFPIPETSMEESDNVTEINPLDEPNNRWTTKENFTEPDPTPTMVPEGKHGTTIDNFENYFNGTYLDNVNNTLQSKISQYKNPLSQ